MLKSRGINLLDHLHSLVGSNGIKTKKINKYSWSAFTNIFNSWMASALACGMVSEPRRAAPAWEETKGLPCWCRDPNCWLDLRQQKNTLIQFAHTMTRRIQFNCIFTFRLLPAHGGGVKLKQCEFESLVSVRVKKKCNNLLSVVDERSYSWHLVWLVALSVLFEILLFSSTL